MASTRACSIASNTARASPPEGARASCRAGIVAGDDSAAASAWPRITAISVLVGTRDGSGSRAVLPASPGGSFENTTSTALSAAIERVVSVTRALEGIERRLFAPRQRHRQLKATLAVDCGRSSPKQR